MDYCVITFASTHGAIRAQALLEREIPVQAMPVLRQISLGCGIALRLPPGQVDRARQMLAGSGLLPGEYAFYGVSGAGRTLEARPLSTSP